MKGLSYTLQGDDTLMVNQGKMGWQERPCNANMPPMTNLRKGSLFELEIENMAYGGQGVGRLKGLVVFVKGAVPGDKVAAQVVKKKKDYAEARITKIL